MKALTICQPYASLILRGDKRVENRTWGTKYRGRFYIHSGKSRQWFDSDADIIKTFGYMPPFGAIIAVATLVDCVFYNDSSFDRYPWLEGHEHANGPVCWILDKVMPVGPWPWGGMQGLFNVDDEALDRVANAIINNER